MSIPDGGYLGCLIEGILAYPIVGRRTLQLRFMLQGEGHQCVIAFKLQFDADVFAVGLHGVRADEKRGSDLFARLVFSDQLENVAFGGRECVYC